MPIALLGLSFNGNTDDVRGSRAINVAEGLLTVGANVVGYDPVANGKFATSVPKVRLVESVKECLEGGDGCTFQAEWPEFKELSGEDFS